MSFLDSGNFGAESKFRFPLPEIIIFREKGESTLIFNVSICVEISSFPTASINPGGLFEGKVFTDIVLGSVESVFLSPKKENISPLVITCTEKGFILTSVSPRGNKRSCFIRAL